jgi:hypothetical protein
MKQQNQNEHLEHPMKRKLICLAGLLPWLSACQATPAARADTPISDSDLKRKFRGIGGVTVVLDSMSAHRYVRFVTDTGRVIASPSGLSRGGRQNLNFSSDSLPVPKAVQVTWKEGEVKNDFPRGWLGGKVVGNYIIEVAQRIPQEVVDDLRRDPKGQLRIKFRLTDDGVLFGWDIERRPGYDPKRSEISVDAVYSMVGGDFQEARIFNGRVVQKGWYVTKNGQKIESDF